MAFIVAVAERLARAAEERWTPPPRPSSLRGRATAMPRARRVRTAAIRGRGDGCRTVRLRREQNASGAAFAGLGMMGGFERGVTQAPPFAYSDKGPRSGNLLLVG